MIPNLERHGGRTAEGIYARTVQRLLAPAAAIWHNWAPAATAKAMITCPRGRWAR